MTLEAGQEWGEVDCNRVTGVSLVSIGERTWRCLKVTLLSNQGKGLGRVPTILAEWYVAESGRIVFFRRYNGPGWRESGSPGSFESLEGNLEVEVEGIRFRHWYDCIPDHVLASVLA